jgi:tripartite-type tricarboxylate transporter receptor subunit TctC
MKNTLLACTLATLAGLAAAQSFPSKPIRILVPSPPGSSPDIRARQIGAHMTESLGQPVIVENRLGANGMIAAREAATRSSPIPAAASTRSSCPYPDSR